MTRFRALGLVGRGSTGAVYRVHDRELDSVVALKTLEKLAPEQVYRLKQEFRALAGIVHPNLVQLHELVVTAETCFFTMEYVAGADFVEHVRRDASTTSHDESILQRFVNAAPQLVEALAAVHAAGRLHRDVKPANVRVTPQGRVVLLDFDLAARLADGQARDTLSRSVAGTYAYMAPEQAWGRPLSAAADWYATGVLFHEVLTGRLPVEGPPAEVLLAKSSTPPHIRAVAPWVPEWLDDLVANMLHPVADRRPGADEIVDRFARASPRPRPAVASVRRTQVGLVGRVKELAQLRELVDGAVAGEPTICIIEGASGIGKTALTEHFLAEIERDPGFVILRGRCHPGESVPYKALDTIIDALSRFLIAQPEASVRALLPRNLGALMRLFPVLARIPGVSASVRAVATADSVETRQRGFMALRELLARLADARPLVVWIDDLQWGDPDSAALLGHLLRPPDPPPLLLLVSHRTEDRVGIPLLDVLVNLAAEERGPRVMAMEVGPLGADEAARLAYALAPAEERSAERIAAITAGAGGSPFLIGVMANRLHPAPRPSEDTPGSVDIDDVIESLLLDLPAGGRHLLELVAVAGEPIERSILLRATARGEAGRPLVDVLERLSLLRATTLGTRPAVETYHDRIREGLIARLGSGAFAARSRELARAFESSGRAEPEILARHFHAAGELAKAAGYAVAAADKASAALAFVRAAEFYRLARVWHPRDGAWTRVLLAREAEALVNAGRFIEGAALYLQASANASPREALEYRRLASEHLLAGGRIDDGIAVLSGLLGELGLFYPPTPRRAMVEVGARTARLFLRRMGAVDVTLAGQANPRDLVRVDACYSAAKSLANADPMRSIYFSLEGLRCALRAGEPVRLGRCLCIVAGSISIVGGRLAAAKGAGMMAAAERIVAVTGSVELQGTLDVVHGQILMLSARWREAVSRCDVGVRRLSEQCRGYAFECNIARTSAMRALEELGEIRELEERARQLMDAAAGAGNAYAEVAAATHLVLTRLAADDVAGARTLARKGFEMWTRTGYHLQHLYSLRAELYCNLYEGRAETGAGRLHEAWSDVRRSGLLRVPLSRIDALNLRARLALATAEVSPNGRPFLRAAARDARRLSRERRVDAIVHARLLGAAIAAMRADRRGAIAALEDATRESEAANMRLHAASARRRKGQLIGGEAGRALVAAADEVMRRSGVARPDRWVALYAPGFGRRTSGE